MECKFTVPDEETYQISDLGEEAGISLYNDKGYLSLRGTGIRSAKDDAREKALRFKGKRAVLLRLLSTLTRRSQKMRPDLFLFPVR